MNSTLHKRISLAAIPVFLACIVILVLFPVTPVFEPPFLLPLLNTVFLGIIPLFFAYIAYRTFRQVGSVSVLLLGCGMLAIGLGSMAAGWLNALPQGANITPTIHNTAVLAGGLLVFLSIVRVMAVTTVSRAPAGPLVPLAAYGGIALCIAALSLAAVAGLTPVFFIQGTGPTAIRQIVLTNALLLFVLSSLLFFLMYRRRQEDFYFGFFVASALIATGLLAVFFQTSVGSPIGWIGRTAQYAGACFALIALLALQARALREGSSLQDQMERVFSEDAASRTLMAAVGAAVILFDRNRIILMANPEGVRRLGGKNAGDVLGRSLHEFIDRESEAALMEMLRTLLRDRKPVRYEDSRDGRFFDTRLFPVSDEQDEVGTILAISTDITEQRQAEAAFREGEERLALSLTASGQAAWDYDVAADTVIASDRMLEIYGIPRDHSLRTMADWHTMILPADLPLIQQSIDHADPAAGSFQAEYRIRRGTDGAIRWIASRGRVIHGTDGREVRRIGVLSDITDRKEAEMALKKSEERLALSLSAAGQAPFEVDLLAGTVTVSDRLREIFGISPGHSLSTMNDWKAVILDEDIPFLRQALVQNGSFSPAFHADFRIRRGTDGAVRWIASHGMMLHDAGGRPARYIGIVSDITDRKEAEVAVARSRARLAEIVNSIQDDFYVIGRDWNIVFANRKFASRIHKRPEDIIGKNLWEVFPKHKGTIVEEKFRAVMETREICHYEIHGKYTNSWFIAVVYPSEEGITVLGTDITERKNMEEALRASEEWLATVLRSSRDAISVRDLAMNRYTVWSPSVTGLIGFTQDEMNSLGYEGAVARLHPDDRGAYLRYAGEVISGAVMPAPVEYRFMVKSGEYRWFSDSQSRVCDARGRPVSLMRISRDITWQKEAEEALRESELRYRRLVDLAPDAILVHQDGKYVYTNSAGVRLFGAASADGILGKNVLDLVPPEDRGIIASRIRDVLETDSKSPLADFHILRPDGSLLDVGVTGTKILFGGRPAVQIILRDITERKKTEATLRESELRYRLVADFTSDWVFWIDHDGIVLYMSPSADKLLGRPAGRYTQIRDLVNDIVYPDDRAAWQTHLDDERDEHGPVEMEFRIVRPDGEVRWIHHICRPVRDAQGRMLGTRGSNRDITARKKAEEELRASLAEKETLIREVHHRVKNNLQVVAGLLDMTRTRSRDESTAAILTDLMLKIQTMAQIHTRLYEAREFKRVDMAAQVQEQVAALTSIYTGRDRPVRCTITSDAIFLPVDQAIPCALVINEVLSNAFKHAFRGRTNGEIAIALARREGKIRIAIRDNGTGLPPRFDPDRSDTLGMKLIRNLVQHQLAGTLSMGGSNGTEVVVEFPLRATEEA